MQALNHIEIRDGEGYISGRSLKAKMVARMHLWENRTIAEVMEHYQLSASEVHAALAFYYDNRERLDQEYAEAVDLMREVGSSTNDFHRKIEARKRSD
jgi:uncharacterized protein (DUF433 family)